MRYALGSLANFERGMKRLSSTDFDRSRETLEDIVSNPYSLKELKWRFRNLRSARFGNHRTIHTVVKEKKEVVLLAVELRSLAYDR